MIVDESIVIIERTTKHLAEHDPDYAQHPAVIAAPGWWLEKVKAYAGAGGTDQEVEEVCGCKVVRKEELEGPTLIAHDGRIWNLLPTWLRPSQAREQA